MDHGRKVKQQRLAFLPAATDEAAIRHGKLRTIIRYQTVILFVLVLAMCINMTVEERPIYYFAMNKDYKTKPLLGLPGATHTYEAITSWTATAAANILSFGFNNIEQRMAENRPYFTTAGYDSFRKALERSKFIERVQEKQQVVTAAPIGAPVIINLRKDPLVGDIWTLQIPFTVTVLSGNQTQAQRRILTIDVIRVPPTKNRFGLGIDKWIES